MRLTITYSVLGSTIDELMRAAEENWKDMSGDESLPSDAEMEIEDAKNLAFDYTARVHIRLKKEKNA